MAGRGQCCRGAEGPQTPEPRSQGAEVESSGCPRCRQREADTAAAGGVSPGTGGWRGPGHKGMWGRGPSLWNSRGAACSTAPGLLQTQARLGSEL